MYRRRAGNVVDGDIAKSRVVSVGGVAPEGEGGAGEKVNRWSSAEYRLSTWAMGALPLGSRRVPEDPAPLSSLKLLRLTSSSVKP